MNYKKNSRDNRSTLQWDLHDINNEASEDMILRMILDTQYNLVILTDGRKIYKANQSFFEFFSDFTDLENFHTKHKSFCELFRTGESSQEYLQPEQCIGGVWLKLLLESPEMDWKVCFVRHDKSYIFALRARKLPGESGLSVVTLQNITQMEQMYQQFAAMFDSHTTSMLLLERSKGQIIRCNHSAELFMGVGKEWYRKPLLELFHTQSGDFGDILRQLKSGKQNRFELFYEKSDGFRYYFEIEIASITLGHQELLHGILHNMTDLKEQEQALWMLTKQMGSEFEGEMGESAKQEQRFMELFEHIYEGVMLISVQNGQLYEIEEINPYACELLGVERFEIEKEQINALPKSLALEEILQHLLDSLEEKFCVSIEFAIPHVGRGEIELRATLHLVFLEEREVAYITLMDVTEKNALERKQKEQERQLIQQSKMAMMGEMIGNIAHQWKQPLNAISLLLGKLSIAQEMKRLDDTMLKEAILKGELLVEHMNQTMADFRNFFKPHPYDSFTPCRAVQEVLKLMGSQFEKQNIMIVTKEHKEHVQVTGSINEFKQVVLNLLSNAKDAITEREIKNGQVTICFYPKDDLLTILVRDNAGGIPKNLLPDALFQSYVSTKGDKGSGVGLWMSQLIIKEKMRGNIRAFNTEDGAEFVITLPIKREKVENRENL